MRLIEPDRDSLISARIVVLESCRSPISPMDLLSVLDRAGVKEEIGKRAIAAELDGGRLDFVAGFDLQTLAKRKPRGI